MSYPFSTIVIVYNPQSTGDSKQHAQQLARQLAAQVSASIQLQATQRAGHAQQLAAQYAHRPATLLVSCSGDGGYNEVINGVLSVDKPQLVTMVVPSGNANDHHHATTERTVAERIISPTQRTIDALQITTADWHQYAHSYIGVGLTAYLGKQLTAAELNPWNEKIILLRYLLRFQAVRLRLADNQSWHQYSSVVFGNVNRMSKVISLGSDSRPDDGQFEVYTTRARSNLAMIGTLLRASTVGLEPQQQTSAFQFETQRAMEVQCDGEVMQLPDSTTATVRIVPAAIRTVA